MKLMLICPSCGCCKTSKESGGCLSRHSHPWKWGRCDPVPVSRWSRRFDTGSHHGRTRRHDASWSPLWLGRVAALVRCVAGGHRTWPAARCHAREPILQARPRGASRTPGSKSRHQVLDTHRMMGNVLVCCCDSSSRFLHSLPVHVVLYSRLMICYAVGCPADRKRRGGGRCDRLTE